MSITAAPAEADVSSATLPFLDLTNPAYSSDTVMTVDRAAVKFNISRANLYRLVASGEVPAWRNERGQIRLLATPTKLALKERK